MEALWSSLKSHGHKTKVRAEMMLIDREIKNRQQAFGVELYDYMDPISKLPIFYSSDDKLTVTLRPHLLTAQREIAALERKRAQRKENLNLAGVQRQAAMARTATSSTWQDKLRNVADMTVNAGSEAKQMTEKALIEQEIATYKHNFGCALYPILAELEDRENWLPTEREVRSIYDKCRSDIDKIKKRKEQKQEELSGVNQGFGAPDDPSKPSIQTTTVPNTVPVSQQPHQPYLVDPATNAQQTSMMGGAAPPSSYYGASGVPAPATSYGGHAQGQGQANFSYGSTTMTTTSTSTTSSSAYVTGTGNSNNVARTPSYASNSVASSSSNNIGTLNGYAAPRQQPVADPLGGFGAGGQATQTRSPNDPFGLYAMQQQPQTQPANQQQYGMSFATKKNQQPQQQQAPSSFDPFVAAATPQPSSMADPFSSQQQRQQSSSLDDPFAGLANRGTEQQQYGDPFMSQSQQQQHQSPW